MKKILLIIVALFLIGCQTNDQQMEEQVSDNIEQEEGQANDGNDELEDNQQDDNQVDEDQAEDNSGDGTDNSIPKEGEHDSSEQIGNEDGSYSPDDAITLVQEFVQGSGTDTELNYSYDGEDEDGNYRIQVFEVVDHGDGESHTATYG